LSTIKLAKERVEIRVKNNGHAVDEKTIKYKWKEGYKNINLYFSDFDYLAFIDNSLDKTPTFLFDMEKTANFVFNLNLITKKIPEYLERRLPAIFKLIQKKD
jgi:predicted ABC-type ATPase